VCKEQLLCQPAVQAMLGDVLGLRIDWLVFARGQWAAASNEGNHVGKKGRLGRQMQPKAGRRRRE